jgi:hypothetical protein
MKHGKSDRKKLVAELDRVFSLYIRARDKACVLCNSVERLQCGHLFTRSSYSTRWDENNAFAQCSKHNYLHELKPYPFYHWYMEKFGKDKLDNLYLKHLQVKKIKDFELLEMIETYKKKLQDLKSSCAS